MSVGVNGHWYVEIEKQAWWRGVQHTWVNRYIMSGAQPSASDATAVIGALHTIEDTLYPHFAAGGGAGFVQGRAYPSGNGTAFAEVDYNSGLAIGTSTGFTGPGTAYTQLSFTGTLENCLVVETRLTGLSSTGKPVFLRKYMRGITIGGEAQSGTPIAAADIAKAAATVLPWKTGVGASDWVVIGASGAQASAAPAPLTYIGNRQVPKGRKKKSTGTVVNLFKSLTALQDDAEALAEDVIPFA